MIQHGFFLFVTSTTYYKYWLQKLKESSHYNNTPGHVNEIESLRKIPERKKIQMYT